MFVESLRIQKRSRSEISSKSNNDWAVIGSRRYESSMSVRLERAISITVRGDLSSSSCTCSQWGATEPC